MKNLKFIIIFLSFNSFLNAQEANNLSSPVTTNSCFKLTPDFKERRECYTTFMRKQIQMGINVEAIVKDNPFELKLMIDYHIDTDAMIHLDSIRTFKHPNNEEVSKNAKEQVEKIFDRINEKTKSGDGLVAALDKNGDKKVEKSYFPIVIASQVYDKKEIEKLTTSFESKFVQKAIYAEKDGENCLLFFQSTKSNGYAVYSFSITTKQMVLLKQYTSFQNLTKEYPLIENTLKSNTYVITYFFYKDYNYLYEIHKKGEEYLVIHNKYKSPVTNMIYENLLSLYNSYFQDKLLKK